MSTVGISIFYSSWCPESLRWLVAVGRKEEALKILKKAAKFNKVEMPDDILDDDEREREALSDEHKPTIRKLFANPKTRRYCIVMFYLV